ncbi:aspartic peptidase A1 [Phakopsora pachyrhizi]|uniref:Aspartic peptidase A1 n=1 Tax=Phakopsora pachyrhizi TaxID=170000 RepID=A0AAV0BNR4_PHAPC|nr:aspartic peptidase A1 [Phakopsora pachyrhizi]CAH7688937.1 aspartic peptidase A1 [Phakopsora pachyrhizi]
MQAIFVGLIFISYFLSASSFPSSTGESNSVRRLQSGGTLIQLSRRGSLADEETGLLNQEALDAHLRYVLRKQIVGAMNYYKNTGSVLATFDMTPVQLENAYNSGTLPLVTEGTSDTSEEPIAASRLLSPAGNVTRTDRPFTIAQIAAGSPPVPMLNLGAKDLIWAAPITIGTPPKQFLVSIDTGSSDLFVASDKCPLDQCAKKNIYTPGKSSTSTPLKRSYSISFGDGSTVKADVLSDTVSMGGISIPNIGMGAVTQLSLEFQSSSGDTSDGLMGFAFPSLSQSQTTPFFTALTASDPQQGIIGTKFVGRSVAGSELTIGGVNPASFKGQFTTLNVLAMTGKPAAFWDVAFGGASVNGKSVTLTSTIATIDTGTSIIGVPMVDAKSIYANIPGAISQGGGQFAFPCTALPMVSMNFGGKTFAINPLDMSIGKDKQGNCIGGIVGLNKKGVWLVGQVFLKNVYTVYDQKNFTVSFADLA